MIYISAGNNLTITAIEIDGIDCSINGSYSNSIREGLVFKFEPLYE
jgi:hypothetical protein